jgi:hypothetical protein
MSRLPPPATFTEGQRLAALWLAAFAGMFCGLFVMGLVLILWLGEWPPATAAQRITVFGITIGGLVFGMLAVILGLLVGGPVGRFTGKIGKDGLTMEAEDQK